jgi:glycosyltransferase involved in cell wall biosynthesis
MKDNILVSIIIPCYNQADYLEETLLSVQAQTYENWECIMVNDGSTDNTEEIAKVWELIDPRFKCITILNGGLSNARNIGLKYSKGEWIQFLDSDDKIHPDKIALSLGNKAKFNLIITNFTMFNASEIIPPFCALHKQKFNLQSILFNWDKKYAIPVHCALIKRDLIGNILFDTELLAKEDWLFWVELFHQSVQIKFINQALAYYRVHDKAMTKNYKFMFDNTAKINKKIFKKLNEKEKFVFFSNITDEYYKLRNDYVELTSSDDIYKEVSEYKRYKKKYYDVWYRKLIYFLFIPKKYKKFYGNNQS